MNDRESLADATKRKARESSFATVVQRDVPSGETTDELEAEVEDCGVYGFLRGVRDQAVQLEFRLKRRAWPAPGYAWLVKPTYDPDGTIALDYASSDRVIIRGRNLRPIYERILRHKVTWIEEQGQEWRGQGADGLTVVYAIEYRDAEAEGVHDVS